MSLMVSKSFSPGGFLALVVLLRPCRGETEPPTIILVIRVGLYSYVKTLIDAQRVAEPFVQVQDLNQRDWL
jgi:hypothetical protein